MTQKKPFPKKTFMDDDIYWKKETVWTFFLVRGLKNVYG